MPSKGSAGRAPAPGWPTSSSASVTSKYRSCSPWARSCARPEAHLANEDLRRLSKERRRVVASLAGDALELARDRGQTVSSAAARELETTLEAAMLDAGAAGELQAGRLERRPRLYRARVGRAPRRPFPPRGQWHAGRLNSP